ncbi:MULTISPECIES: YscO family type III secretion system apparatus protein [Bradyrhizobium]|uniref:YscO family type III secretion system apparatus protein n=1 Tax=Bradyrhizobium TaxID=374 RepID=UPI001144340F|nr:MULTISPECIES: YscO family type III secretion system apparatus protein [Bradyrhizobium]MCA6103906.1 YscO family type III secretion system apparatus protein [Bradyrhizobium australafricanum]
MDVTFDRLNTAHASKLRAVKDMRERSALRELSNMEAKRRIAGEAVEQASEQLANAERHRARVEAELYREMLSADAISVSELERRHHLIIGRLTEDIAAAQLLLDKAHTAQDQAEAAVREARTLWAKRSAACHKWQEIERDVERITNAHVEAAAEIEADDEVLLRYRRGAPVQAGGEPS